MKPAKPMPLLIKPDRKLSARDVMELMRDHFEGTRDGHDQGHRRRPLRPALPLAADDLEDGQGRQGGYFNERAISTQQTGFSFVAQSRSWLPDPIGGVLWFGVDDTYSTVYVPMYCGIREVPASFAKGTGTFNQFSWDSAFWVFNFVANYAYSRYSDMILDIQKVQRELEGKFLAVQPELESAALDCSSARPSWRATA